MKNRGRGRREKSVEKSVVVVNSKATLPVRLVLSASHCFRIPTNSIPGLYGNAAYQREWIAIVGRTRLQLVVLYFAFQRGLIAADGLSQVVGFGEPMRQRVDSMDGWINERRVDKHQKE